MAPLQRGKGGNILAHPKAGAIEFEHTTLTVDGAGELRVVVYTPTPGESAARLERLLRRARPAGETSQIAEIPSLALS